MTILEYTRLPSAEKRMFRTAAARPLALLQQCPVYEPTPLSQHSGLAAHLGISSLLIKDEAQRMRLGSFKALGGAFAVAQMISDAAETTDMESKKAKAVAAEMTFVTASAGNHGLSVAAGARIFGAKAVILLSSAVPEDFAERIRGLDSDVVRVDGSYEDSVAAALQMAEANDWLLLADGSWSGYIERPALVMEGYTVMGEECRDVFSQSDVWPSHVVLQAGVGGLAAAMAGHIRDFWPLQPYIAVVEPDAAPCLMQSIQAQNLVHADGPLSNMGRLDCKDASLIAYDSLKRDADAFILISDDEAVRATAVLAQHGVRTTTSGAASFAGLSHLNLGADSRCLIIVTEGPEDG